MGLLGVVEAFRQARIESSATFNFTPYLVTAISLSCFTIPLTRLTDWLVERDQAPACWRSRCERRALELEGVHKSFGNNDVLRGSPRGAEHEVVCLIGASGSGKSTLLRCVNLLEAIDEGASSSTATRSPTRRPRRSCPAPDRDRLPGRSTSSRI